QLFNIVNGNELRWAIGGETVLGVENQGFGLEATVFGSIPMSESVDPNDINETVNTDRAAPIEFVAAATSTYESGMTLSVGGGVGLSPGLGAPKYRALVGVAYEFPVMITDPNFLDTDGDGLRDGLDKCPGDPEDSDGFDDEDGCPEYDNDLDGVNDDVDQCPDLAEDLDGFEDQDGCHDPDNDQDGLQDEKDQCPGQPEDWDNFEDDDGCPEKDNDFDGIPDDKDQCSLEAEDLDNFEDTDGCPEPDNDGDGALDAQDRCPNDPKDQCIANRQGDFIKFRGKILFELDKAVLLNSSLGIIEAVIDVLRNAEDIRLLEIQGHTDSSGSSKYNRQLSQARAEAVMNYMIEAGISQKRLRARGYGEEQSRRTNDTEAGRAVNRRVEFKIIKLED
ncbi:MAG: OmpA family protein, partial [Myxococcota bacterium]|nr:OmpA family protein [Myxococcota bacterium]